MPFRLQIWATSLAGAVAALVSGLIVDICCQAGDSLAARNGQWPNTQGLVYFLYAGIFAIVLGLAAGIADSAFRETQAQRRASILTGIACGFAGALAGPSISIGFSRLIPTPYDIGDASAGFFFVYIVLLSLGWAVIGGFAGVIRGICRRSRAIAAWGATGGSLGGFIGGVSFQIGLCLFSRGDPLGDAWRFGSLIGVGALSGALSLLLSEWKKQAWLDRLSLAGHNRQYTIGRPAFRIGSARDCDIVITGDPGVAPVHVVVEAIPQTMRHRLRHAARSPSGQSRYTATILNGESMTSEKWLVDGDTIKIGGSDFRFREKATQAERIQRQQIQSASPLQSTDSELAGEMHTIMGIGGFSDPNTDIEVASDATSSLTQPTNGKSIIGTRFACIEGPYRGQSFALRHETILIGRSLDQGIPLPADTSVSRTHARITYEGGRHIISDAGSAYGVLINDRPLTEPRPLTISDTVTVGATILRYE